MKIVIKVDSNDDADVPMSIDNIDLDNKNFVNLNIGDESYLIPLDDLDVIVTAFRRDRENDNQREKHFKEIGL